MRVLYSYQIASKTIEKTILLYFYGIMINCFHYLNLSFEFKYFITTINVIALKFPSILWPIKNNPTAIGNRIMP
jgi:hypothetical protein